MMTITSDNIPHSHALLFVPRVELRLRLELLLLLIDGLLLLAPAPLDALLDEKRPGQILLR
jgi:hypothetical protein